MKTFILIGLVLVGMGGVAFVSGSWWIAHLHTAPVPFPSGPPPMAWRDRAEAVVLQTEDGLRLHGTYVPLPDAHGTAILLHRYQAGRDFMWSRADWYLRQGFSVLLYDARATGESEGHRISLGYHETKDLQAALAWVRGRDPSPLVLHGVSQGGATIVLAADMLGEDVAAVIIESTYDTLINAGDRRFRLRLGVPGWLAGFVYRLAMERLLGINLADAAPIAMVDQLNAPLLVLAGTADVHTWAEDTDRLFAAAREPKVLGWFEGAAHVDLHAFDPDHFEALLSAFIQRYPGALPVPVATAGDAAIPSQPAAATDARDH